MARDVGYLPLYEPRQRRRVPSQRRARRARRINSSVGDPRKAATALVTLGGDFTMASSAITCQPKLTWVHFHTIGIYETFSGPDSIPHRPIDMGWIEMNGTPQNVIVPL
jgi:hypothetical protein